MTALDKDVCYSAVFVLVVTEPIAVYITQVFSCHGMH